MIGDLDAGRLISILSMDTLMAKWSWLLLLQIEHILMFGPRSLETASSFLERSKVAI